MEAPAGSISWSPGCSPSSSRGRSHLANHSRRSSAMCSGGLLRWVIAAQWLLGPRFPRQAPGGLREILDDRPIWYGTSSDAIKPRAGRCPPCGALLPLPASQEPSKRRTHRGKNPSSLLIISVGFSSRRHPSHMPSIQIKRPCQRGGAGECRPAAGSASTPRDEQLLAASFMRMPCWARKAWL